MFAQQLLDGSVVPPTRSSSLDPLESPLAHASNSASSPAPPWPPPLAHNFRHSSWSHDRERIWQALHNVDARIARLNRFAACGRHFMVLQHRTEPGRFKRIYEHCRDRFCVPCGRERRATIQANCAKALRDPPYRFASFTLRNTDGPLAPKIDRLHHAFRQLRRTSLWQGHVTGGCAFLEIKRGRFSGHWHPHLHCILAGTYIDQGDLSREWHAITGDSKIVDIRLVRDAGRVAEYVSKYSTKPLPASIIRSPQDLEEAARALHHRRLLITFGTWRNLRLTTPPDDTAWTLFATECELHYKASLDDPLARNVLSMLNTADSQTGEFFVELDPDQQEQPP